MQDINVLVTFCSRTGSTERLALAAALGSVQARAFIRLRWLNEIADDQTVNATPGWRENRDRMAKEYVAPRDADFLWADALVIGMPAAAGVISPEMNAHLNSLKALKSAGKLHAKVATAFTVGSTATGHTDPALVALCSALLELDLILVPPGPTPNTDAVASARLQGRRVAEVARALRQTHMATQASASSPA
jgi:NAD(P)H dehydrogenase (quinone)